MATAGAAQTLITPAHSWVLNDRGSGSAGTAQDGGSLGSFFTGQIAHVTTWNSALTGGQIAKLS